jgi:hypothetical protein
LPSAIKGRKMFNKDEIAFTTIEGKKHYIIGGQDYEDKGKVCPICHKLTDFHVSPYKVYDYYTDCVVSESKEVYCGNGCELWGDDYLNTPPQAKLDKQALKAKIMASRARIIGDSIEVFNDCDNPYLHGFNCLYVHWQALGYGSYSVFYDYYLEHGYQGRDSGVGKKEMLNQKKKPTSKEVKALLCNWMIERFETSTSKSGKHE